MDNASAALHSKALKTSAAHQYILPEILTSALAPRASENARKQFKARLAKWVNQHRARSRERSVASSLAEKIQFVTLPEFYAAFDRQLDWLNQRLKMPYHLTVHVKKDKKSDLVVPTSTGWLAQRVMHNLRAPMRGIALQVDREDLDFSGAAWPEHVVYADDGTYSGDQVSWFMSRLIGRLVVHVKERAQASSRFDGLKLPAVNVWFAVPYRTRQGNKVLLNIKQRMLGAIATHIQRMPDAKGRRQAAAALEIVKQRLSVHVCPFYEKVTSALRVAEKLDLKLHADTGAGLLIFEHKIPDDLSFPLDLARGCLIKPADPDDSESNPAYELRCTDLDLMHRLPFVSQEDDKPYRIENPGIMRHIAGGSDNMHLDRIKNLDSKRWF